MFDQVFENFRKASESSLQAQQDFFKNWLQQLPSTPFTAAGPSSPGRRGLTVTTTANPTSLLSPRGS